MRTSRRFMARGLFHELRGSMRAFVGRISSSPVLTYKGTFERFTGKVQWKLGKTQSLFGF